MWSDSQTLWIRKCQGSLHHEILCYILLGHMPFSRDLPTQGLNSCPCLAGGFFVASRLLLKVPSQTHGSVVIAVLMLEIKTLAGMPAFTVWAETCAYRHTESQASLGMLSLGSHDTQLFDSTPKVLLSEIFIWCPSSSSAIILLITPPGRAYCNSVLGLFFCQYYLVI